MQKESSGIGKYVGEISCMVVQVNCCFLIGSKARFLPGALTVRAICVAPRRSRTSGFAVMRRTSCASFVVGTPKSGYVGGIMQRAGRAAIDPSSWCNEARLRVPSRGIEY